MVGLDGGPFGSDFGLAVREVGDVDRSVGTVEVIIAGLVVAVERS